MTATLLTMHVRDRTRRTAPGIGSAASISFTGEVHDDETGLDTYKFRSYNPQLGRWMSPAPSSLRFANLAMTLPLERVAHRRTGFGLSSGCG